MAVTQKDIARAAGVSQAVVSDVLQDRPRGRVSAETRARILETAARLGYRPNAAARALRSRHSYQVLYVATRAEADRFQALSERVVTGIAETLSAAGYRLLIDVAPSPSEAVVRVRDAVESGACDGCILRAFEWGGEDWSPWRTMPCPVVVVGQCRDEQLPSIAHDAPETLRRAVRHLEALGRRRLGLLTGRQAGDYYRQIRQTWAEDPAAQGESTARRIAEAGDRGAATECVLQWLSEPDAPHALICLNDRGAVGATSAVHRAGLEIGRELDLLVVGSVSSAWLYEPGTWLFGTDLARIGRDAAETMLRLLQGEAPAGPVRIIPDLRRL